MRIHTLNLSDLANELDDLREKPEGELDSDEEDRFAELTEMEHTLGDLHAYSRNVNETLIHNRDFVDYIRDQTEENLDIDQAIANYIDWERYAADCEYDYYTVVYEGNDYLIPAR